MSNWQQTENYLFYIPNNFKITEKIAGFDLDHTLIKPASGNVFPKKFDDWILWEDSVSTKLHHLINNKYSVCIFSNQSKIKSKEDTSLFKNKMESILKLLNIDIPIFISINKGFYRKPFTGLWDLMIKVLNVKLISPDSFYCGDAAGRFAKWKKGKKKDFACTDRMFAYNISVNFHTPEYIFLNESESEKWCFNEIVIHHKFSDNIKHDKLNELDNKKSKIMYISVGAQGSGKSTVANKYFDTYKTISQDELKDKKKCIKKALELTKNGDNIIVDNTNPDKETRKLYIDIAKTEGYEINCLLFTTSIELCKYLNCIRCQLSSGEKKLIPDIAYNVYKKKLVEPSIDEGFDNIYKYEPNIIISDKFKF